MPRFVAQYRCMMLKHASVALRDKRSAAKEQLSFLVIMLALALFRLLLNNIDDTSDLRPLHEPQPIPSLESTPSARQCSAKSCILAFVPNDDCTKRIAQTVIMHQDAQSWLLPKGFENDIDVEVFYLENPGTVLAAISTELRPAGCACATAPECSMSYSIMINGSYLVGSSSMGWAEFRSISAGFVTVQNAVDEALLHLYAGDGSTMRMHLQTTTQEYTVGLSFIGSSSIFGGFCLILSFIPNVHFLIMNIVEERRTGGFHELRRSGLSESVFWASWLSWMLLMNGCVAIFVVSVSSFLGLFKGSNLPLCILFFALYLFSCGTFAFFISSFFDRPQLAGAVGTTFYGLVSFLYFLMRILDANTSVINWLFFLPPVAMGSVTESMWNGEARWGLLTSGRFPMVYSGVALAAGGLIYFAAVCFNSRISHRMRCQKSTNDDETPLVDGGRRLVLQGTQLRHIYGEGSGRSFYLPFIAKRSYSRLGSTVAIDEVDIDLCFGEIMIILGPNGAGKSTLLSILSQKIVPTSGHVSVFNSFHIGYCPQTDSLISWPRLTGRQHLEIYARIKLSVLLADASTSIIDYVNDALQLVQISDLDADRPVMEYSGGLRRLLSVAVALLGSPQILMLDEPLSSISPSECSMLINSIRGFSSRGGSVIMATHNFSDVEELADRVAVLGDGCLKAIGTPKYFKQRFGAGFELRCETEISDSALLASHAQAVLQVVCAHVPESTIRSAFGSTMIFNIPASHEEPEHNADQTAMLSMLLSSLQKSSFRHAITSCFISSVTLEQIFTGISHGGDNGENNQASDISIFSDAIESAPTSSLKLHWNQFKAISWKKILVIRRDTRLMVYALIYPLLLFGAIIAMSFVELSGFEAQVPLPFDINMGDAMNKWRSFPVANTAGSDADKFLMHMPVSLQQGDCAVGSQCFFSRIFGQASDLYAYLRAQVILKEIRDDPAQLKKIQPDQEAAIHWSQTDGLSYFGGLRINSFFMNANEIAFDAVMVFNNSAEHSASYVQNVLSNSFLSILKNATQNITAASGAATSSPSDIKTSIITRSRPLPFKYKFVDVGALVQALGCLLVFTWAVPLITETIVRERQAHIFQQLKLLGLPPVVMWLSYLVIDSIFISVAIVITLVLGRVTNKGSFNIKYFPATALLCLFYAPAMASFAHLSSFAFSKPDIVLKYLTIIIFVSAGSLFGTLAALSISDPGLASLVGWVLGFYPPCGFAWGIFQLASQSAFDSQAAVTNSIQLISPQLIQFVLSSLMFTSSCVLLDTFWHHFLSDEFTQTSRPTQRSETPREDVDVRRERSLVKSTLMQPLDSARSIIANQLGKVYGDMVTGIPALYDLSFVSQAGEITCIMGPSGSGKSAIISILAGTCNPSSGSATFRDHLNASPRGLYGRTGVVFQSDTVWDELTPREYLALLFCISGLSHSVSLVKISQAISVFGLESSSDTPARALSPGCRRKMCVAAVLLGQLPFLIFDEPLLGFDAISKRNFWTLLQKAKSSSFAPVILMTTHSIDEAETASSKLGILVEGHLRCIGSPAHLHKRFSRHLTVNVQCSNNIVSLETALRALDHHMKLAEVVRRSRVYLLTKSVDQIALLQCLGKLHSEGILQRFSVGFTSLREVYLRASQHATKDADE